MTRPGGVVTAAQMVGAELAKTQEQLAAERRRNGGLKGLMAQRAAEAAEEIRSLREQLTQAERYASSVRDAAAAAAADLVVAYEAWQCVDGSPNCRQRFYADDPDHACGPLTPVTVTVSRRSP